MWRSDSDRTLASSSTPPLPTMWPSFSWGIPALVTGQIGSLLCKTGPYYKARGQCQISQLPPCPLRCCLHPADNPSWPIFSLSLSLSLLLPGLVTVGSFQTTSQCICFRIQDWSLCMTSLKTCPATGAGSKKTKIGYDKCPCLIFDFVRVTRLVWFCYSTQRELQFNLVIL